MNKPKYKVSSELSGGKFHGNSTLGKELQEIKDTENAVNGLPSTKWSIIYIHITLYGHVCSPDLSSGQGVIGNGVSVLQTTN